MYIILKLDVAVLFTLKRKTDSLSLQTTDKSF